MKKLLDLLSTIGIRQDDQEDVVLQKRFMVYQAVLMSAGGIVWVIFTASFNRVWQSTIPLAYILLTVGNLFIFSRAKNFNAAKNFQTGISLFLPFLLQWSLGGFVASGVVMLWALLSLAASVTYQSNRVINLWLSLYIVLSIVSAAFDRQFEAWIQPGDAYSYSTLLLVCNIIIISSIMLWLINYLVRGKNKMYRSLHRAQAQLVQSEKMATLGTLAAGVAHELNNPAAATRRAAEQLRNAFADLEQAHTRLNASLSYTDCEKEIISLEELAREKSKEVKTLDGLTRSDLEADLEDWLDDQNIPNSSDLAPALINLDIDSNSLDRIKGTFTEDALPSVLTWLTSIYTVYTLLNEIGQASSRISEIIKALKSYSFLGQAPVQFVNIHEGIDNTLIILRNKLKKGINVKRQYDHNLPQVCGYGSELNQVWTNLLDNAADALNDSGEIGIRTYSENGWAVVEIEDNGPGIPNDIQSRIFDPFFTTKDLGKGTGLGLSTSYGIITEKHKGQIMVESRPGSTRFTVRLPIGNLEQMN